MRRTRTVVTLGILLAASLAGGEARAEERQPGMPMRRVTNAEREAAAKRMRVRRAAEAAARRKAAEERRAEPGGATGALSGAGALLRLALAQLPAPDLYASPNWVNSPLPVFTCSQSPTECVKDSDCPGFDGGETCSGPYVRGGIRKFVDTLAGLCGISPANTLNQCIPLATPDRTAFPGRCSVTAATTCGTAADCPAGEACQGGADYYEIGLRDYTQQFHTDLPATTQLRGYYQKNAGGPAGQNHYLGPVILATRDRPVRVKFVNELGTSASPTSALPGGDGRLFVPNDPSVPGAGPGPDGTPYTENRATLHLHGGNTQWISDGFQHQWTAPAGDPTTHRKGVSTAYVPDMWFDAAGNLVPACAGAMTCSAVAGASTNPGDGAMTFYYPNQQSGRFMFYHDHAHGITRLNVYVGEASGYVLVDPVEEDALAAATVPGTLGAAFDVAHYLPLILQDKTFVPEPAALQAGDPTWDVARYGGYGNLWYPHVYTPNQWPGNPDLSNTNPFGRWDYGPWFWPPQTSLTAGQLEVPCYTAALPPHPDDPDPANPSTPNTVCPGTPNPSIVPESFLDTMLVNGTAYPTAEVDPVAYRFQVLNASQERQLSLSLFVADASGTEVPMVDAIPHSAGSAVPLCAATAPRSAVTGTPNGPDLATPTCWPRTWPTDGRVGGVPDPAAVGPQIVQIGTEGGLLPAPAVIPPQPVDYEYNRRNVVVLNISSKGLFLGPAERADVVVDFSAYAGRTLILYNDAPAPVPGFDTRLDYFTGAPDQTGTGGAPTTHAGFGPNTRTVMQIRVRAAPAAPAPQPFDAQRAAAALAALFRTQQPAPVVPEAAYNAVYAPGTTTLSNIWMPIQATELTFTPVGGNAPMTLRFGNKAIVELFDLDYGRMNTTLGSEMPLTSFLQQTTIPFTSWDPTTEFIIDDTPQIWKITHNGVDTHPIHFHLLNVQVLNRVGWDGQIRPPDANELGWKDTVRMHPLEDIFVALRPVRQTLPWPLPDSIRPLDPTRPLGSTTQFTAIDVNNLPIPGGVTNQLVNFGWEYVWHCHLLGHEENDMLRAEVFVVAPETPADLAVTGALSGGQVALQLGWTDTSLSAMAFDGQRATDPNFTQDVVPFSVAAPATTFADTAAADTTYFYRVRASKSFTSPAVPGDRFSASSTWSNVASFVPAPAAAVAPAALAFGAQLVTTSSAPRTVTLSNTGTATMTYAYAVTGAGAASFAATDACGGSIAPGASCAISVVFAPEATGPSAASLDVATSAPGAPLAVALGGTGVFRQLTLVPADMQFASPLLVRTAAQTVVVTNTGTDNVSLSSVAIGGADASQFARTHDCVATMVPGATCTISVTFRPTSLGAKAAAIAVVSNGLGSPQAVALSGVVQVPVLQLAPAGLDFGTVQVLQTSAPQLVTVSNAGDAPLSILGVGLAGASANQYVRTHDCPATLAPGATCTASVSLRPTSAGTKAAVLAVSVASPAASGSVTLTGLAPVPAPVLTVTPEALDLGAQALRTSSASQAVTVRNTGNANLALQGIVITGPDATQFSRSHNCVATMVPGASCTVNVRFRPTSAGPKSATLGVNAAAPAASAQVGLTGLGQ